MNKKKKYIPKPFESDGSKSDTSANIYHSMLISPQWKALSKGAMVLYLYCKAQYYAEKSKPVSKYKTLSESEKARCFTMNKAKRDGYELYSDHAGQFQKEMKELLQYGFVDIVEQGKNTRTKNIYMLSDRWNKPK